MDAPLVVAGLMLGVAASPHCAVMCGAPCAALTAGCRRNASGFHLGRLIGYAAAGALAAVSVEALGAWSRTLPALRPLWTLLHLGLLALGLWWLATGRQPAWMRRGSGAVPVRIVGRRARPLRSAVAGLAWVAWPCVALQAALLLAALASSAPGGALVMAAFALGSMPALALTPWLWGRWQALQGAAASPAQIAALGLRVAGGALVLASGWALTQGLWQRFAAWCLA
ncbi:MAG: sulfite exporter TauE/SafE family protein [Burkholderiales bacterium]|nr:sulfite exporter TauE/SafE family protein [Burkholderiales bacterium]